MVALLPDPVGRRPARGRDDLVGARARHLGRADDQPARRRRDRPGQALGEPLCPPGVDRRRLPRLGARGGGRRGACQGRGKLGRRGADRRRLHGGGRRSRLARLPDRDARDGVDDRDLARRLGVGGDPGVPRPGDSDPGRQRPPDGRRGTRPAPAAERLLGTCRLVHRLAGGEGMGLPAGDGPDRGRHPAAVRPARRSDDRGQGGGGLRRDDPRSTGSPGADRRRDDLFDEPLLDWPGPTSLSRSDSVGPNSKSRNDWAPE